MKTMSGWMVGTVLVVGLGAVVAGAQTAPLSPARYDMRAMPAIAAQGAAGQSNADSKMKDDLFAGTEVFEKGASDVTEITMDPDTLNLVGGNEEHKAHNMVLNVVRTYTYDKPGMYNMADVDAYRNKLNTGDWHCSVHTRELKTGESTDVCSKRRTDGLKETAIITVSPKELTFIHTIRRANGPGSSELGGMPLLPGVGPLPMMAMIDPEAIATMEAGLHSVMPFVVQAELPDLTLQMKDLQVKMKKLPKVKIDEKQFDEMKKQLQEELKLLPEVPKQPE